MLLLSLGIALVLHDAPHKMQPADLIAHYVVALEMAHESISSAGAWDFEEFAGGCTILDKSEADLFVVRADSEFCQQIILSRKAAMSAIPALVRAIRLMPQDATTLAFAREATRSIFEPINKGTWASIAFAEEFQQ
jgi:hypothetical protein